MINWTRTSMRHLVYQLRHSENEVTETAAYARLVDELGRYFHGAVTSRGWYGIFKYKQEIIHNAILTLVYPKTAFRGNSWQYRKYVRRTLLTTCSRYLAKLGDWESIDEPIHGRESDTLIDLLTDRMEVSQLTDMSDSFILIAPDRLFSDEEQAELLQTAVTQLSQRDQQLLQLADVDGLAHKEIAEQLGMSHGNVRTSLNRARIRYLQQILHHLAIRDLPLPKEQLLRAMEQLPDEQQIILQAWWEGMTNWNKLGQLLSPVRSQADTQELFAQGLGRLFYLIQTHEVNR